MRSKVYYHKSGVDTVLTPEQKEDILNGKYFLDKIFLLKEMAGWQFKIYSPNIPHIIRFYDAHGTHFSQLFDFEIKVSKSDFFGTPYSNRGPTVSHKSLSEAFSGEGDIHQVIDDFVESDVISNHLVSRNHDISLMYRERFKCDLFDFLTTCEKNFHTLYVHTKVKMIVKYGDPENIKKLVDLAIIDEVQDG